MKSIFKKNNRGFTVLFAVIVSSIVLAIGLSIANITLKQIRISSLGRESQIAFYAADSGSECVMYHDLIGQAFATSAATDLGLLPGTIDCFGREGDIENVDTAELSATTTVDLRGGGADGLCVSVQIGKHDTNGDGYTDRTIILSRGYNTCSEDASRLLERGIRIRY